MVKDKEKKQEDCKEEVNKEKGLENHDINALEQEIKALKEDLSKQKDLLLRTAAEYENFRKRTEREKSSIYADATSDSIIGILPVADSLQRAIESSADASDEYKKGLEMINSQFKTSLGKLGVESFGCIGDEFNPSIHNAVSHIDDESLGENAVSQVFQVGYKIGDRVIRHAMVQVAN